MSVAAAASPERFSISRTIGDTFGVIGRNIGLISGLLALFCGLPALILEYSIPGAMTPSPDTADTSSTAGIIAMVVYGIVTLIVGVLLLAALPHIALDDIQGRRATFDSSLSTAAATALPVAGIAILAYVPILLGLAFSIVAEVILSYGYGIGFILAFVLWIAILLRWFLAVPIQVQERLGVFASMKRSAALTEGSRWALLGLSVILAIASFVLQVVLTFLAMLLPARGVAFGMGVASMTGLVVMIVASAVSYPQLRAMKEGSRA